MPLERTLARRTTSCGSPTAHEPDITSAVSRAGLVLNKGGPDNHKLTMATHIYKIPAWQPIANQLAQLGICTLADIQGPTGQLTSQLQDHLPQFPPLPLPLDTAATTLLPNQFWMPCGRTEQGAVLEIVSNTPTATLYRKWYPTEPDMRLGPGRPDFPDDHHHESGK